jgi:hypothetical protein
MKMKDKSDKIEGLGQPKQTVFGSKAYSSLGVKK